MARKPTAQAAAFLRRVRATTGMIVPPAYPLPSGTTVDDSSFDTPVTQTTVTGAVKLSGKKATGSTGKFVYSIAAAPQAGYKYTTQIDPDFSALAQQGKLAFTGFGLKSGNNFHLMGLKGDGSTGLNAAKISGANFNLTTGQTVTTVGAAHAGTQAGPNWLQLEISNDGTTYTLRTSADGTTWTDEITAAAPSPLNNATSATSFGIAGYFDGTDAGNFSIDVKLWQASAIPPDGLLLSSSDELDSPSNLLLSGDAQSGTDALAI